MATDEYPYEALKISNNRTRLNFASGNQRRWRIRCICFVVLSTMFIIALFCFLTSKIYFYKQIQITKTKQTQKVLLISLDGFRHNLRQKTTTPHLDWVVDNGVSTDYVLNVFPTLTVPNHQSIVTGLYPENHGVIANKMYDRKSNQTFHMEDVIPLFWNDATPIWIENELQGHKSGNCFWPGYNVLFDGRQASYLPSDRYTSPLAENMKQKNIMPFNDRVDLAIDWLKHDDVTFVSLYIDEPDLLEHKVGPDPTLAHDRAKLEAMVQNVDGVIGRVLKKVKEERLESQVNIIIMGDHGQTQMDPVHKVIDLTKYVNLTTEADFFGDGFVYAKPSKIESIYKSLRKAEKDYKGNFKVYLKKDIPHDLHVRNHERTGDILFVVEPGWVVWQYGTFDQSKVHLGNHCFSNKVRDMNPAFFAVGPLFRANFTLPVINMVDVYSLMCYILQISPRKHDGDFERIKSILM